MNTVTAIAIITLSLSILGIVWNGAANFGKIRAEIENLKKSTSDNSKFSSIDQRLVRIEAFMDSWLSNISPPRAGGRRDYDRRIED
jgi:hypothetical protein